MRLSSTCIKIVYGIQPVLCPTGKLKNTMKDYPILLYCAHISFYDMYMILSMIVWNVDFEDFHNTRRC